MKDYFDLWALSTAEHIDHAVFPKDYATSFERRPTHLPDQIQVELTESCATAEGQLWTALLKRGQLEAPPWDEVIKD